MADCTGNLDTLPLIILLRASTVNAREMNNAKISSVDLKHSKSVEIQSLLQKHPGGLKGPL